MAAVSSLLRKLDVSHIVAARHAADGCHAAAIGIGSADAAAFAAIAKCLQAGAHSHQVHGASLQSAGVAAVTRAPCAHPVPPGIVASRSA